LVLDALRTTLPSQLVDFAGKPLLSRREQDVVRGIVEGMTNREIAKHLNLSVHTVKNYVFRIFETLGVSSRVEVVLYAVSQASRSQPTIEPSTDLVLGQAPNWGEQVRSTRFQAERCG
jgi:DNA-binding NarL/FixJ family response regulator